MRGVMSSAGARLIRLNPRLVEHEPNDLAAAVAGATCCIIRLGAPCTFRRTQTAAGK